MPPSRSTARSPESPPRCPICNDLGPVPSRRYHGARWPAWECPACRVAYVWPLPEPRELAEVYRFERYANVVYRGASTRSRRRERMIDGLLAKTERSIQRTGRLLDVGCSTGTLLRIAAGRGWKVEGLERDPATVEIARRDTGVPVHCVETIGELPPDRSYDLIVMSHVLEHVRDPSEALRQARARLGASGHLLVRVPNADSVASRSTGRLWPWFCPPIHLYYFGPEALTALLGRSGFRLRWSSTWLGDANSVPVDVASAAVRLGVEIVRGSPGPDRRSASAIAVENPALRTARERVDERTISALGDRGDSELMVLAEVTPDPPQQG